MSKERFEIVENRIGDKIAVIRENELVAIQQQGFFRINQKDPRANDNFKYDSILISREDIVTLAKMIEKGEI